MKDNSLYKLGGMCSILLAVSTLVASVTGALIPSNLWGVPDVQSPFMYWEENRILLLTNWRAIAGGSLLDLFVHESRLRGIFKRNDIRASEIRITNYQISSAMPTLVSRVLRRVPGRESKTAP